MDSEFLNKQPNRRRPDTDYDACLICQKGAESHSRPMQKLPDKGYPALIFAITNRKDEISFRLQNEVDPHSDFLENNMVCLARYHSKSQYAPSTLTTIMLTREKASLRNKKTLCCKCDQFYVATFSLPVSLAATRAVPIPFPPALARSVDLALSPVEMFTISCSSHLNGWISWLLMTPVIFFTPSFRLACW